MGVHGAPATEEPCVKKTTLEVTGMTCAHCVSAVRGALNSISGVKVDALSIGSASVTYDETSATVGDLVDAIQDAGYEAREAA
jgi:copper chaperone CopZ